VIQRCLVSVLAVLVAGPALADPCKAIPDKGVMPTFLGAGKTFSGPVVYIGDGDSLCVETSLGPNGWVEVRLEDFYAPELHEPGGQAAKQRLEGLVKGRRLVCKSDRVG
jgi:micrococcal nuclease